MACLRGVRLAAWRVHWILALGMSGCSPTQVLNFTANADRYRVSVDVPYGESPRQVMDVYRDPDLAGMNHCRIVFTYGGSWESGSKSDYGFVGAALAKLGYTVFIPDYRLYPEVRYPAFVNDLALALTHPQIATGYGEAPLVLMGHSAGAMLAGLVSFDHRYLQRHQLPVDLIDAYVAISGPHDYFLPTDNPQWTAIFGEDPDAQIDALTVNHVTEKAPPTLILHGLKDDVVTPKSAQSLARELQRVNVAQTLKLYERTGHRRILAALAPPLGFLAPTLHDIDAFLRDTVCGKH